jgi:hypothetical protein
MRKRNQIFHLRGPVMQTRRRSFMLCCSVALAFVIASAISPAPTRAAINSVLTSNVDAYFGSQSDGYQDRFPLSLPSSWPAVGSGPYPVTATYVITSAPPPPASLIPTNVTPFGGAGSLTNFADVPGNSALSFIQGYIAAPGNTIDDAQIALKMQINQVGASSYAYEQLDYNIDYSLVNTPNSAGFISGVLPGLVTRAYSVSGNVGTGPGSYAQFGGEMNFWSVSGGVPTSIGTLLFSYLNTTPGGAFSTIVTSSGTIGSIAVNSPDSIRITGAFYVAGDPSSITIQSLPEPSALGLVCMGGVSLLRRARRRA